MRNKSSHYTINNKVELIKGGAFYFNKLEQIIDLAKHSIYIKIYIWEQDITGTRIAEALTRAANRGVSVFATADGYASQNLSVDFLGRLAQHHVHFKFFEPLLKSAHFYFGRRMHEKIIVIDGIYAMVGGVNFSDKYNDINQIKAWLDFAVFTEGEAAYELYCYCAAAWHKKIPELPQFTTSSPGELPCSVRVRRNDWVKGLQQVWYTYFNWFNHARESITIMCSYFLPGRVLRERLRKAAKRGVRIKVILAGRSDIMLAKHAERYLYRWMLKNGMEIYEYDPTVLHAKMMVADKKVTTIGSFNVNNVSAYASLEVNLDMRNKKFATKVQETMDQIISENCLKVTEDNFITHATFFKRLVQKSAYELIRMMLNLSTFYFKPERVIK